VRELLSDVVTADSPALATVEALRRWRSLFSDTAATPGLDRQRLVGLIGELLILEEVLRLDTGRRLDAWVGPLGGVHDFRRGRTALEVKSTMVREGRVVPVSGIAQLEAPEEGTLHVAHLRLASDPAGNTLPETVDRILALGVVARDLLLLLDRVGYHLDDADHYMEQRFRVVDRRIYDAGDRAFPRLTPASFTGGVMPAGVLNVDYEIDLTNEPPVPVSEVTGSAVLSQIAGMA